MSNQFIGTFAFDPLWQTIVPWFAKHVLHLSEDITIFTNGSGDTSYNYVSLLVYVLTALLVAAIWSVLDRRRDNYIVLLHWLVVLIRYYLIYQMITYGFAKLFYLQFQSPRHARLIQSYGDSSPMGLLWTFMGFSKGYTMFAGAGELMGGLLLLIRRTRTLGAIIVFGVMSNVMALNFFYDVPVKILSSHIVALSIFIILLDGRRLWRVFISNEVAPSSVIRPNFSDPKTERIFSIIKWVVVVAGLSFMMYRMQDLVQTYGSSAQRPLLYGLYEAETFVKNGVEVPPLVTDVERWRYIAVDFKDRAQIQMMNGNTKFVHFLPDSLETKIYIHDMGIADRDSLLYSFPDSSHLKLDGVYQGDTLDIMMKISKKADFLLMNRGFHFVNEYPFNR